MRAYLKMLPRIAAQEQLSRIDAAALAAGGYEQNDSRRLFDRLRAHAIGEPERKPAQRANANQLASMGIAMTIVPAPEAANNG